MRRLCLPFLRGYAWCWRRSRWTCASPSTAAWGEDVYSGHLFAFVSRRGDRIKVLMWSQGGFVLLYNRLETGRFRLPRVEAKAVTLDATQLAMLLDGIDVAEVKRQSAWAPPGRTGS
ncbi:transposase [Corallococcus sp. CA047B]|uniref:IS66 family insertion sequence element accessory protein TnpB n=1 Tax=Corallococcus sp. CA047B TaxID=2316729 RepID=UPI000EA3D4C9|nr:IS66 family insertion sequence element accessory protein TnpB [Corallococcus sp. CA047B]RKH20211.1 transposase [Corallococcus sp. CA047B]